jgi:uncharacterized protein YjdB
MVRLQLEPVSATIPLGTVQPFMAKGTYSDGSVRDVTGQVTWTSSDAAVAELSRAAGLASGCGKGSATITARVSGVKADATLVVTDAALVALSVAPQSTSVPVGFDAQFVATGAYSDGSILDLTAQVVWSSSDDAIAVLSSTVGEEGLVRGVSTGSAAITAREAATGLEAHATCAVTNAVAVSVVVSTATPSVPLGRPAQFVAMGTFSDGSTNDVTAHATWSSSSPAVAIISNDPGSQGLATTVSTGTTSITAALGAVPPASADLTVTDAVLESIEVNPSNPTIVAGGSITLEAVGIWSDGTVTSLAVPVTWSSSDTAVATVSDGGLVRCVAVGTTTVTAGDAADGLTGSTTVTVVSPGSAVLSYVSVTPGSVKSGRTANGTVVFTGPFAADVTVALASDQPYAAVPPEVILPAGETSVTFTITTSAPPPATKKSTKARATISATTAFDGVVTKTARLMVRR